MSKADEIFIEMCRDILENGTDTQGEAVRAKWPDGSPAYTIRIFGQAHTYDLAKEFPIMTLRKTALKSATDEMLWIYQKKSSNTGNLKSHVWDEWADESGSIGKAYGYQIAEKYLYKGVSEEGLDKAFPGWKKEAKEDTIEYSYVPGPGAAPLEERYKSGTDAYERIGTPDIIYNKADKTALMDQMNKVIYDLKINPFSRRIMTTTWNVAELKDMHLEPCAYSMTYNVVKTPGDDKLTLNAVLNQRSQDMLAANNWNIVQYSVLVHMLAQVCDMHVGKLLHVIADCHVYDRHVDAIKELMGRTPLPAPAFHLNPDIKDFYDFTSADVSVEGYEVAGEQIKDIPIAV
ncbi:thymidylate synthase [Butyrivibrio sp. MC2013]|uniref:thymidylate synthase n=1 Tax=Butyrivibrio sp. MC2013 TaxID=1280686 RepID=UPI0004152400|nr:thymidylate synthase [Butyrivibrio sp. MC2013]